MEKKEILLPHGKRKELIEFFKTSYPVVKRALSYKTKTDFSEKIRAKAFEMGGNLAFKIDDLKKA